MQCAKVSTMIRITLKGNPGPLEEVIKMKNMIKTICEKILSSLREGFGGLLVRLQGVAMLTHLQRSCSLLQPCAQHRCSAGTGSRVPAPFAGRAQRAHLGSLKLREDSVWFTHSSLPSPTRVCGMLNFYLPAYKKTKGVRVLRTKALTSKPFGYLLHAEHRGAMRDKRQIAAETKGVTVLRTRFSHILNFRKENR